MKICLRNQIKRKRINRGRWLNVGQWGPAANRLIGETWSAGSIPAPSVFKEIAMGELWPCMDDSPHAQEADMNPVSRLTGGVLKRYADWTLHMLNDLSSMRWVIGWTTLATGGEHIVTSEMYYVPWKELKDYDSDVQNFIRTYQKRQAGGVEGSVMDMQFKEAIKGSILENK